VAKLSGACYRIVKALSTKSYEIVIGMIFQIEQYYYQYAANSIA